MDEFPVPGPTERAPPLREIEPELNFPKMSLDKI
jgi:hypothetical protein